MYFFKDLNEHLRSYGLLLKSEKILQVEIQCQFGHSRVSKILLSLVAIIAITFTLIGFTIGHCIILNFKK
jgi:hypothetical protein